jgi:hypothetical protein
MDTDIYTRLKDKYRCLARKLTEEAPGLLIHLYSSCVRRS